MAGKHIVKGTFEVQNAKTDKEAVNLGQVKELISRYYKEPVKAATVGELSGSYADNVLTLDSQLSTLDGVALADGDSILVKDQSDKTKNGIYVIDSTLQVLTRREDFDEGEVILNSTFVNVMQGDTNGDTKWTIVSSNVVTIGSENVIFIKEIVASQSSLKVAKASFSSGDNDGNSVKVVHNFNLTDEYAYMLIVRDIDGNTIICDDEPTTGDKSNSITLTFDSLTGVTRYTAYILGLE